VHRCGFSEIPMTLPLARQIAEFFPPDDQRVFKDHERVIEQLIPHVNWGFVFDQERWMELAFDVDASIKWLCIIQDLAGRKNFEQPFSVLEIGPGSTESVVRALALSRIPARYSAINENRPLSVGLRDSLRKYEFPANVISADVFGMDISECDLLVLHHALNDIVESALAKERSIDVVDRNWRDTRVERFRAVRNTICMPDGHEKIVSIFRCLIEKASEALSKGGHLVANHCCFQNEIRDGYDCRLNNSFVDIFRSLLMSSGKFKELPNDFGRQWWITAVRR
jgi:hypothetical protein